MIAIIDYGMGNLGSIANMLKKIGAQAVITSNPGVLKGASKLILPGVGAFDTAMNNLSSRGIIDILNQRVLGEKVPILGICLGIQLFTKRSDEGRLPGLGWIDAETVAFAKNIDVSRYTIPHMGWNTVCVKKDHPVVANAEVDLRFYFVHSYFLKCENDSDVLCTTDYGIEFVSAIARGNIVGVQFHPEKSHKFGMGLLKNFAGV
jgi:imidazole glycerol-phosphate synthase subunit HisH